MSEYEEVAFAELLSERLRNGVYKPKEFHGRGIRVVNMKELFAYDRIEDQPELRVDLTEAEMRRFALQPDDLLFARRSFVLEGAGKCSIVGEPSEPLVFESSMIRARVDKQRADPVFLYYFFRSPLGRGLMSTIATRTAVSGITGKDLAQLRLPLPSLDVQRSTSRLLSDFDALIENNRRRVEVLEEMARAIYREWFVHFRYPGHEAVPLVDSPLGQIPDGWHVRPSSEVLEINPRVPLPRGTRCRHMTMGDLDERVMNCEPSGWKDSPSGSKFVNGDTLFARITPCLENGKTGFVQALDDGEAACGSTEFVVLRGRLVGPTFTYLLARSDDFRGHAISSMSGASGRQRVRNECFDSVLVATPPEEIAAAFESVAQPLFSLSWSLHCEATKLASLRDLLLPKLVTGKIDVSQLDLDGLIEAVSA